VCGTSRDDATVDLRRASGLARRRWRRGYSAASRPGRPPIRQRPPRQAASRQHVGLRRAAAGGAASLVARTAGSPAFITAHASEEPGPGRERDGLTASHRGPPLAAPTSRSGRCARGGGSADPPDVPADPGRRAITPCAPHSQAHRRRGRSWRSSSARRSGGRRRR
jgi:hypothetical protein